MSFRSASFLKLAKAGVLAVAASFLSAGVAGEIVIGQVASRSGPDAKQARAYATGMELAFKQSNRSGGVNGNTFSLLRKELDGPSDQLIEETRKLVDQTPPMLLAGLCGDLFVNGLVQSGLLGKEGLPLVGYRAVLTVADTPLLFNGRASIKDEVDKIAGHLSLMGIKRWGLLLEDGSNSEALRAMVEAAAARSDARLVSLSSYEAGSTRVVSAVETNIKVEPQAIFLVSSGPAAVRFIEQYRQAGGGAQLFVHSGADLEQLVREIGQSNMAFISHAMQGVVILQVSPNPHKQSPLVSKEFREAARAAAVAPASLGYVTMEGFLTGKLIIEAVRRQGPRITRASMAKGLEGMGNFDLGGYMISFKPGRSIGSRYVELTVVDGIGRVVE